jgi:hypothetical protein
MFAAWRIWQIWWTIDGVVIVRGVIADSEDADEELWVDRVAVDLNVRDGGWIR